MPLAISLVVETRVAGRSARTVLSGLSGQESADLPEWAKAHITGDSLTARGLKTTELCAALEALSPHCHDDRIGAMDWVAHDDSTILVDLLLPLLVLARDLGELGESTAEVVLDGA